MSEIPRPCIYRKLNLFYTQKIFLYLIEIKGLLKDSESEVRAQTSTQLRDFCDGLPEEGPPRKVDLIMTDLLPIITDLVKDQNAHVKTACAGVIMHLAPILGKDNTIEHLLPLFLIALKDDVSISQ